MNDKVQEKSIQLISKQDIKSDVEKEDPPKEKPIRLFHKHYRCSQHDHDLNNGLLFQGEDFGLWESDTYRFEFNISIFIKSLVFSIVDILGLKILLFLYTWISGSKYLYNFYRLGTINSFINLFGWINMLLVIFCIYEKNFIYTDAISLNYMAGLFFVSIVGASKMSFLNNKISLLLETVELSEMSCIKGSEMKRAYTEFELTRTILRLNLESSSFFMSFLEDTRANSDANAFFFLRKSLRDPVQMDDGFFSNPKDQTQRKFKISDLLEKGDWLILNRPISKSDLVEQAVLFENIIFYYKFLAEPSQWDTAKVYGYQYANNILAAYQPFYPYARFLFSVGFIGTIIVSFMKLDTSDLNKSSENPILGYIAKGVLLLLNAIVTIAILFFISESTDMIWNRLCFVKGLTELISEETPPQDSIFRKWNSMINIFDFESLRTWASLRLIFMNMSQKRLESISLAISVIVAIQLIIISVLGFFYFTAEGSEQKALFLQYIIFFGTPTIIYMIYVLFFIYVGSQVNNQYQDHIYLLKTLKITINKLFAFYPTYTGDIRIQPSTYLVSRGLRYLQKSFEGQEMTQALLKERLEEINNAYDTIITELEIEEKHRPLTLLGIPMTDSFAGTVFGTILTVILIPVTKYLAEVTGWD